MWWVTSALKRHSGNRRRHNAFQRGVLLSVRHAVWTVYSSGWTSVEITNKNTREKVRLLCLVPCAQDICDTCHLSHVLLRRCPIGTDHNAYRMDCSASCPHQQVLSSVDGAKVTVTKPAGGSRFGTCEIKHSLSYKIEVTISIHNLYVLLQNNAEKKAGTESIDTISMHMWKSN